MKHLKIFIICIAFCLPFFSTNRLPFTGTRYFNFTGGSCCNESITINKDGECIIKAYQAPKLGDKITIIYKGVYKPIVWIYSKGKKSYAYKIEQDFITQLNKNGIPEIGCKEDNKPCRTELYK